MKSNTYNAAIAVGILLTAAGAGLWGGLAAALVTAGALVRGFTVYGAQLARRAGR